MKQVVVDLDGLVNKAHQELIGDYSHRIEVVYGGAGSGKSFDVGIKWILYSYAKKGMKLLVVRKTARSNRESTFALLKDIIVGFNKLQHFKINSSDMKITNIVTGCEFIFAGLDDVEKLKSIQGITDIWIEEASEIDEADFNQLNTRLRGGNVHKQIVLTFNPIDINHWIKHKLIDANDPNVLVNHTTYKDNEHIDEEYKKVLESYKDTDPYHYQVYALGQWGIMSGCVFAANKINERLQVISKPISTGYFAYTYDGLKIDKIKWFEQENGMISIYQKPNKNLVYGIGADTAGEGSDYFVGQVLDQNGNQVAILRQQMDSDLFTKQIYCLGKFYNNALLTIEVNFDSYPIQELQRIGYNNMYIREVNDTALNKYRKAYGFRTDSWTRPAILNHLIEIVRDHTEFLSDKTTMEEMLTFVRNEKGRMEAAIGAHDDTVMALAIAYEGMSQVRIRKPKANYLDDDGDNKKRSLEEYWG